MEYKILMILIAISIAITVLGIAIINNKNQDNQDNQDTPDNSGKDQEEESLTSKLSFEDAKTLLGSDLIEENKISLNNNLYTINDTQETFQNLTSNLKPVNTSINYNLPDYLETGNTTSLNIARSDIQLYNSKYEELSEKSNNLTQLAIDLINDISSLLSNLKNELNDINTEFEETIKNLCLPFLLEEKELAGQEDDKRRRMEYKQLIEEYKEEVNNYNELLNDFFPNISNSVKSIEKMVEKFYQFINLIVIEIEESKMEYENLLKNLSNPDDLHTNLITAKKTFLDIKDSMNEKESLVDLYISSYENSISMNSFDFESFRNKMDRIMKNLTDISNSIREEIIEMRRKNNITDTNVPELKAASTISDSIIKTINRAYEIIISYEIKIKRELETFIVLINVEEKTSLDLLFVMDLTGSMTFYIEEAKDNILEIIDRIISECPGIDINLGFIGYRDIEEHEYGYYVDVNFTKNYTELKHIIDDVYADGGADTPEDVSWAMEKSLQKEWKNNARFVILVADAPNHGLEYHDRYLDESYPEGIPGSKNLTESIQELAESNVSLFCLKITYYTDIMYDIFEGIYKKYEDCEFHIVDMNSDEFFSDVVVNSAIKVYENQRNTEIN